MQYTAFEFIPNLADAGAEAMVKNYCILSNGDRIKLVPLVLWGGIESANVRTLQSHNVKIFSIYNRQSFVNRVFNKMFGKYYVPFKINQLLKRHNGKVVHVHLSLLEHARRLADINKEIYFFYTCHNEVNYYFPDKKCEQFVSAQELLQMNRLTMVALHEKMKSELQSVFNTDKVVVFKNGIDFKLFQNCNVDKRKKRQSLDIPNNAFVVGHVGRFSKQKNHEKLVDIFNEIKKVNPNAFLLMIGEGEKQPEIEDKLSDLCLQDSYKILSKRSDVNELLQIMDVFVFPSLFEGFSVVLLEAQVAGLKCVISDTISKSSHLSNKLAVLSLTDSSKEWANRALLSSQDIDSYGDINQYDLNNIIVDIEKYYLQTVREDT